MRRLLILAVVVVGCVAGLILFRQQVTRGPARGTGLEATDARPYPAARRASPSAAPRLASDALLAREARAEVLGRFDAWAAAYLATTDAAAREAALPAGIAAATARRAILRDLIAADPELALSRAVPWGVRAGLPADILPLLEDRVDGMGGYHALGSLPQAGAVDESSPPSSAAGPASSTRRIVELGGQVYEAFTYGRRLELGSRARLAVHGIAIDGRLALSDSPVRALEAGEPVPAGRTVESVCAISGWATDSATAPAAADIGDRVIYLCSAGHIGLLASRLESAEEAGGGEETSSAAQADDILASGAGARRVLMIRVRFADQPGWFAPETDASAAAMFAATDAFYLENSFGTLRIEGTVSPIYTLPQTAEWYSANDTSGYALNILQAARAIAANPASAPGNDGLAAHSYLDYDFEAVRYTAGPGAFSGQGYVARRGCWIKSPDAGVLIHELGHNLGLWHANAWTPADTLVPLGAGTNAEYGDQFDTMGPARGSPWHFNTWEKRHLGWLASADVVTVSASTTLTLAAHDLGAAPAAGLPRAVRIARDDDREYWVDFRRHPGWSASRPGVHDGVTLRWDPWARSNGGTQLLDATPGSPDGRDDATLALGRTFADPAAGIYITPVAVNTSGSTAVSLDVRVGSFAGNRAPSVAVGATATEARVGQAVQFTASASDADGDALSYSWSFDESGATASGAVVSHAWSSEGDQRARVTVSDRRGGIASASVIVRVGASAGSRIRGRVLDLAGAPVPGVLVHNGTEPGADDYRCAWSDADGSFTLLGVPQGTWQPAAAAPGWLFAVDGFSHPVITPGEGGELTVRGHWKGFSISGTVRRADGTPLAGALVRVTDRVEPTDAFGEFAVTGLAPGRHVLGVESAEAAFAPHTVELGLGDVSDVYLEEKTFTVSGTVSAASPAAVSVTTGWQSTSVACSGASDSPARFSLEGVSAGTWTVRAVAADGTFSPAGLAVPVAVQADVAGLVLSGDAEPRYAIAGVVRDRGFGVAGATVSAGGVSTTTDSRGGYWLPGLAAGRHDLGVSAPGLAFAPAARAVEIVSAHVTGIDFETDRANTPPAITAAPHVVGSAGRPFITLAASASDDDAENLLRFWWSVVGDAPGDVAFATSGANAARETVARFSAPGDYTIRVTAIDRHGAAQEAEFVLTAGGAVGPPVITEAARAEPAFVGGALATRLSVRAASDAGDDRLVYAWSADPGAPGPVGFSANASPAAREVTARFRNPGNYVLRAVVRDPAGRAVESSVSVRVELTYASWLSGHFDPAVVADASLRASVWGELADADGDGVANLLEYAFGGDPTEASSDTRPVTHFVTEDGVEYLAVTFRPNPDATDLHFEPQLSSDLETWQGGAVFIPTDDGRTLTYRDPTPAAAHQRRFIRVLVQPLH